MLLRNENTEQLENNPLNLYHIMVTQHERPPAPVQSNPPGYVGGGVFSANKAIIVAPYLMAILSVVAVAAVVVKRKLT